VRTRASTPKSIEILMNMDAPAQAEVLQSLKTWKALLASLDIESGPTSEKDFSKKALAHFRLNLQDSNWASISDGEIIEIYNSTGVQLYRSMNFFEICGYSLLDLCVNKWFELWERPTSTLQKMNETVHGVLTGAKKDFRAFVAPHVVRENYDDGTTQPFTPRTTLVSFQNIFPLFSPDLPGLVAGFLVTSKGEPISTGEAAIELGFI
jgi:hypothetical protein